MLGPATSTISDEQPRRLRPRQQRHHHARGRRGRRGRQHAAVAVGQPADERALAASSAAATRNVAPITGGRRAELVEPQRREHVERAEHQPDEHDQPHPGRDPRLAQRGEHASGSCGGGPTARTCRRAQRPHQQARAPPTRDAAEHDLRAERHRGGAEHRAAERADDRRRHRRADQLAAALARRGADQPADRARPRRRPAEPLDEAGDVEDDDAVREGERERGRDQQSRGRRTTVGAHAEPRGQPAAGQRAEERPGRVRRREDPGAGLAEAELLGVGRQQRDDRREEDRVEEDDRRGEEEEAAHGPRDARARPGARRGGYPYGQGSILSACGSARSRPSACAPQPSPAKRTTTMPPGSVAVTTPSPNAAWMTSSPRRKTAPAVSGARLGGGGRRVRPRGDAAGRPAGADRGLVLEVGQLARDLVDEARAHAERVRAPNELRRRAKVSVRSRIARVSPT